MQPVFGLYNEVGGAELLCPSFGGECLHHERVEIFQREQDQEQGLHVSVGAGRAVIDTNLAGNPSIRRHGLSIHFSCESCDAKPVLYIAQHKGTTYVNFAPKRMKPNKRGNRDAPRWISPPGVTLSRTHQEHGTMKDFDSEMEKHLVAWRKKNVSTTKEGCQNNVTKPWILPWELWEEGLWPGIRSEGRYPLNQYLEKEGVKRHTGSHNLKSSWVLGANLYFPFRHSLSALGVLAGFLMRHVDRRVESVDSMELEYAEPDPLSPQGLLGEMHGKRGWRQTTPDIGLRVNGGKGLLLIEVKFTEHSFYGCSAHKRSDARFPNPDPSRCNDVCAIINDVTRCHQQAWGRKYWELLRSSVNRDRMARLSRCPAAHTGYQLLRQQALAEGIAKSGKYKFVVSAVALDERNERLISSMNSTGLPDVRNWGSLFDGTARFAVFTHQDWTRWVRQHDTNGEWSNWAAWVEQRYKL